MIVTTHIDLSPQTYLFFVRQAEQAENQTPENMISLFLESCIGAQFHWNEDGTEVPPPAL